MLDVLPASPTDPPISPGDYGVALTSSQVYHLLNPLTSLFEPRILWAVLSRELVLRRQNPGIPKHPEVSSSPAPLRALDEVAR